MVPNTVPTQFLPLMLYSLDCGERAARPSQSFGHHPKSMVAFSAHPRRSAMSGMQLTNGLIMSSVADKRKGKAAKRSLSRLWASHGPIAPACGARPLANRKDGVAWAPLWPTTAQQNGSRS